MRPDRRPNAPPQHAHTDLNTLGPDPRRILAIGPWRRVALEQRAHDLGLGPGPGRCWRFGEFQRREEWRCEQLQRREALWRLRFWHAASHPEEHGGSR